MTERSFLDTNILVYADDRSEPSKQVIARQLIRSGFDSGKIVLSTQVLQEYFVSATKKLGLSAEKARRKVEIYGTQPIVRPDLELLLRAIDIHRWHQMSLWDSLVICAAQDGACKILYSEDMQDGQRFGSVKVVNPFRNQEETH